MFCLPVVILHCFLLQAWIVCFFLHALFFLVEICCLYSLKHVRLYLFIRIDYMLFCFIFFLVWIQHLFCQACLFFNIEQKLIGDHPNIIDNILHIFHIKPSEEVGNGVLLIISSLIMAMLFAELVFRTISGIKSWI